MFHQAQSTTDRDLKDHYVLVDGVRMHYTRSGSGPALVLIHGLVGSAKNWQSNIDSWSRNATVYALDLPNMGLSARAANVDASQAATADKVAAWMEAVGLADADIVGHSHGGAVTMMLAARHPEKVRRLVLFAPANPFCDSGRHLIRFYRTRVGTWLARRIPLMPRAVTHLALSRMYGDPSRVRPGALDAYIGTFNRASIDHVLQIVRLWGKDMKALHASLTTLAERQVLMIWGDGDRAVNIRSSERLREFMPQAALYVIPGAGHLPFEETPELANRAVHQWLQHGSIANSRPAAAEPNAWDRAALQTR